MLYTEPPVIAVLTLALFAALSVVLLAFALRAAKEIARSGRLDRARVPVPKAGPSRGEVTRVRGYIAWGGRDLFGRLRVTLRKLYRSVPPSAGEASADEALLSSLLEQTQTEPKARRAQESVRLALNAAELWERRLHRRPSEERR